MAATRVGCLAFLALACACGPGADADAGDLDRVGSANSDTTFVRGDTIVRLARTALHPAGGELIEDLSIGVVDGPEAYMFASVRVGTLGPDGAIYVLDGQAQVVRRYDRDGTYIRDYGRPGPGPEEYQGAAMIGLARDGTVLIGARNRRGTIHRFAPSGESLGHWEVGPIVGPMTVDTAGVIHVGVPGLPRATPALADLESIDSTVNSIEVIVGSGLTMKASTLRLFPDGSLSDTVAAPDLRDLDAYVEPLGGGRVYIGIDYSPAASWGWSASGELISGESDRYAIDIRRAASAGSNVQASAGASAQGTASAPQPSDSILSIRREAERVPIGAAERALVQKQFDFLREAIESATWHGPTEPPAHKPAFYRVLTGLDARIWVQLHTESEPVPHYDDRWREASTAFDIFEPDGTYVGGVTGPRGIQPLAMTGDTILAAATHETGVPLVKRFVVRWRER